MLNVMVPTCVSLKIIYLLNATITTFRYLIKNDLVRERSFEWILQISATIKFIIFVIIVSVSLHYAIFYNTTRRIYKSKCIT
jgi:hypothetical protein